MKAVEFASTMTQEGQISLPPELAGEFRPESGSAWLSCGSPPAPTRRGGR
jgi:hypothetical protein